MTKRLLLYCMALPLVGWSASLTVTVKDPSGGVVAGADVRLRSPLLASPLGKLTGVEGAAKFDELANATYTVRVQHEGFADDEREVAVSGEAAVIVVLKIATQETSLDVTGKESSQANSDPSYRALRNAAIGEAFVVENIVLRRDVGVLTLKSGTLGFAAPVLGRWAIAVFSGQGRFELKPTRESEANMMNLLTGSRAIDEEFESMVLTFSDGTYEELKGQLKTVTDGARVADILRDTRHRLRHRTETPRSLVEALMQGDGVVNIEAELLNDLYNPSHASSFSAYIRGRHFGDLRFFVKPAGAIPGMLSPEEVGLVNLDTTGSQDGILYLTHYAAEWEKGTASSDENRKMLAPLHYKIETVIGNNGRLSAVTNLKFIAKRDGDRVFRFDLLPTLRVKRVSLLGKDPASKEIGFIQEPRRQDGAFYIVLPQASVSNQSVDVQIEYEGNKVVENAGGGSFAIGARESWYPSVNSFSDRATYDLIFKIPKRYVLVSVGKLVDQRREDEYAVTHWVSDVPLPVAGFNYGDFKVKKVSDKDSKYDFETYATSDVPDYLRQAREFSSMTPSSMANSAMIDAENSMRVYNSWFGEIPFGRIAITQQPQFGFGQSWPSLVYLPLSAFLDSTQRYMLLGSRTFRFSDFIQEVTPHEVAHQWWGHMVGWSSYHDQWLSEGFADFSASLFLQFTKKNDEAYLKYWEHGRKAILERNSFGFAPNDAGPIWMGMRLDTYKTAGAYQRMIYPKGGFVLHMLRWLMYDAKTGNRDFIDTMHDFVKTYGLKIASTEDFKTIVENHMKPSMDLAGNKRMDWFFDEWVYGTQVPSYRIDYHVTPGADGKVMFAAKITQSGVGERFRMKVPVYIDFGEGPPARLGGIALTGNSTTAEFKVPLPRAPKKVLLNYNFDVLAHETVVNAQ